MVVAGAGGDVLISSVVGTNVDGIVVDGIVVDTAGGRSSPTGAKIVMPIPVAIDAKRIVNHSASVGRRCTGSLG
jgi:hypothetical protein